MLSLEKGPWIIINDSDIDERHEDIVGFDIHVSPVNPHGISNRFSPVSGSEDNLLKYSIGMLFTGEG
jgi:hypothetical protein